MRFIDGEIYLSPGEAGAKIGVSHKTVMRWVEAGELKRWVMKDGKRVKVSHPVNIQPKYTFSGCRLYKESDIEKLIQEIEKDAK